MTDDQNHRALQALGDDIGAFLDSIPYVDRGADIRIGSAALNTGAIAVSYDTLREAARVLSAAPYILR